MAPRSILFVSERVLKALKDVEITRHVGALNTALPASNLDDQDPFSFVCDEERLLIQSERNQQPVF